MKKISILFLFLLLVYSNFAQDREKEEDFEILKLSLSSGHGPLSSGLFFEGDFLLNKKDILNISLGGDDMYLMYLKSMNKKSTIFLGPSLEYYYNVPVLGVVGVTNPLSGDLSLKTLTWSGISAGNPDEKVELLNWRFLFFWQSATLSYKNISFTSAILHFYNKWGHLYDLKYTQKISKNFSVFASGGYNFYGDGKALLKLGLTYEPY